MHGGITEQDIEKKVNEAIELAEQNKAAYPPVDTVLFFDEANTTEAIGLIKEIMCDKRLNGEPLPEDIKFIAACNPYRKYVVAIVIVTVIMCFNQAFKRNDSKT